MSEQNHILKEPRPSRAMRLSSQDFANWGLHEAAYVRPMTVHHGETLTDPETVYAVHAANGQSLGVMDSHAHAVAAIMQQGMQPYSVH